MEDAVVSIDKSLATIARASAQPLKPAQAAQPTQPVQAAQPVKTVPIQPVKPWPGCQQAGSGCP